jgi:hypothetical protein
VNLATWQRVIGYAGLVLSFGAAGWLVWQRVVRKAELTKTARIIAAAVLSLALVCYFAAMPTSSYVRIGGIAVALFMLAASLWQFRREETGAAAGKKSSKGSEPERAMTRKDMPWHKERKKKHTRKR